MARTIRPEFFAREAGADRLHDIPVERGDGTDGFIAQFVTDMSQNGLGDVVVESTMMVDRSSLEDYEFIGVDTHKEVTPQEVVEQLR